MGYAMDVDKDSWRTFMRIYVLVDAIKRNGTPEAIYFSKYYESRIPL